MIPKYRLPTLPGQILQTEFLDPLQLSQVEFSSHLGGTWIQPKLNAIINGRRQVTVDIALDFSEALGTSPQFWLNLQNNYNLASAQKQRRKIPKIKHLPRRAVKTSSL